MKYKKIIISAVCFVASASIFAHTSKLPCDTTKLVLSPFDLYAGMGLVVGQSAAGSEINFLQSYEFNVGVAYRWKVVGIGAYYKSTDFSLKQDSEKIVPNKILHDAEKISLDNLGLNVFVPIRFANTFFLELGAYAEYAVTRKDVAWDYLPVANNYGARLDKSINERLDFVNPWNYGLRLCVMRKVRPGYSLYVNYRLSKVFSQGSGFPELPRLAIGLNLNII